MNCVLKVQNRVQRRRNYREDYWSERPIDLVRRYCQEDLVSTIVRYRGRNSDIFELIEVIKGITA